MKKVLTLFTTCAILSGCFGSGSEEYNDSIKDHSSYHCQNQTFDPNSVRDLAEVEKVHCDIQDFPNEDLSQLSQFTNLTTLYLDGRQTMEQQSIIFNSSWTPKLKTLSLNNINFETIDLSQLEQINRLSLNNVNMPSLDLTNLETLKHFILNKTNLTSLDLSYNAALEEVLIKETKIELFDFSGNTKLIELSLAWNSETNSSIELTNQPALKHLSILNQEIKNLYVNLPNLERANFNNNKLTSVDFSGSPELSTLLLWDNLLTDINVDANKKLSHLNLTGNPLTEEARSYLKTLTWIDNLEY